MPQQVYKFPLRGPNKHLPKNFPLRGPNKHMQYLVPKNFPLRGPNKHKKSPPPLRSQLSLTLRIEFGGGSSQNTP